MLQRSFKPGLDLFLFYLAISASTQIFTIPCVMDVLRPGATAALGRRLPAGAKLEPAGQPSENLKCSEVDWLSHALTRNGTFFVGSSLKKVTVDCRWNYVPVNPVAKEARH